MGDRLNVKYLGRDEGGKCLFSRARDHTEEPTIEHTIAENVHTVPEHTVTVQTVAKDAVSEPGQTVTEYPAVESTVPRHTDSRGFVQSTFEALSRGISSMFKVCHQYLHHSIGFLSLCNS